MREFFRGWRRKAGCVALVIACTIQAIGAARGSHLLLKMDLILLESDLIPYRIVVARKNLKLVKVASRLSEFSWQLIGGNLSITDEDICYDIPYWSLVLPPTLLSAVLLLWPRPKRARSIAIETELPRR